MRSHIALLAGAALLLLGLLLAEFVTFPATGHRIDTTKWPVEAQAILREKPGVPISPEQWKRIDKVLRVHGDMNCGQPPYWAQTVRASWWWFLLLPVLAVLWFGQKRRLPVLSVALLTVPSAAIMLAGVVLAKAA